MKKKRDQSGAASSEQQPGDYVVGLVSGSLFQKNSAASSSSLSALFSTAAPAAPVLFQPAPKPVKRSVEVKQTETREGEGKSSANKKSTKQLNKKSEAEQQLENREFSLQTADEDEGGQERPSKKKKKKQNESELAESGRVNDAEHWVMKRQKQRARKEEEAKKNKRTVFVGNLPISCTKKMLMTLFRDKGPIESIRFRSVVREDPSISRKVAVIQRKAHPKKQSMNAYVVFKDEEGVARALERNGAEIENGFHIRVDKVADGSSHDHKRSVFVGNLSFEISELALRRHFEECGSVEAVRLVRDQNSGLGKGFGYVLFESADSVQLALKLDGTKLDGRSVRVKRSVKKEKQKNKPDSKMAAGRPGKSPGKGPPKGPAKGRARSPAKGPGQDRGGGRGFKKFPGKQKMSTNSSGSFSGEKVDPNKKAKKKGLKKKAKPKKAVHI